MLIIEMNNDEKKGTHKKKRENCRKLFSIFVPVLRKLFLIRRANNAGRLLFCSPSFDSPVLYDDVN